MNVSSQRLLSPAGFRPRPARRGFALIVTLSLMTLLLLMVLTLVILVKVNMQTATTNLVNAQARQNALVGAQIGLGQLQKFAGPDQRVTTTADFGRTNDKDQITSAGIFHPVPEPGSSIDVPQTDTLPYGTGGGQVGGTRAWTAVWGSEHAPLSIYTAGNSTTNPNPQAVLLTFLVSGNENVPLIMGGTVKSRTGSGTTGQVQIPTIANYITFSSNTSTIYSNISSNSQQTSWNALTNNLYIANTASVAQPAIMLAGLNTVGNSTFALYTSNSGAGSSGNIAFATGISESVNNIIVPMVNITVPSEQVTTTNNVTGHMAYWVRDEGVKAKYTPTDPYAGQTLSTAAANLTGNIGQLARSRYNAPQRNGMERMDGFGNYSSLFPPQTALTTQTATNIALMNQVTEPAQILLIDGNLSSGVNAPTATNPQLPLKYLQQHFNDFTIYSYGLEADTLRGGLRYDLTTAFENTTALITASPVFTTTPLGLNGIAFLPFATDGGNIAASTEPNAAMVASGASETATLPSQTGTQVAFDGPGMAPKWNILRNFYSIAANIAGDVSAGTPVIMQAANSTTGNIGISPVIVQGRLAFGLYSDSNQQPGIATFALFVLANPYNFPIQAPATGIDLGYRISTNTGEEWSLSVLVRSSDQHTFVNPYGTRTDVNSLSNAWSPAPGEADLGSGGGGFGFSGYFPILTNPISFPQKGIDSLLDQLAFHISPADSLLQPGEAKLYSIGLPVGSASPVPLNVAPNGSFSGGARPQAGFLLRATPTSVVGGPTNLQCMGYIQNNFTVGGALFYSVPMTPGLNTNGFILRMAGLVTTSASGLASTPTGFTPVTTGLITGNTFPDPVAWGWLSSVHPSVAMTVELRIGGQAPGNQTLQNIINLDLSGAGLSNPMTPLVVSSSSTAGPTMTYTAFGSGNNTTYYHNYPTNGNATHGSYGNLPYYIGTYAFMMVPPVSKTYDFSANYNSGISPTYILTPNLTVSFRNFADYNLRATNMALPPFMPLTKPTNSPKSSTDILANNNFLTVPLYARYFDQGPYDGGSTAPAGAASDPFIPFSQNLPGPSAWGNDVPWGYSDANTVAGVAPPRYNVFYSLPQRSQKSPGGTGITVLGPAGTVVASDAPILSIGQLTSADVTADDVYISVGYQPGNAIGNSLYTPYVSRSHIIEYHNNLNALIPTANGTPSSLSGNTSTYIGNSTISQTYKNWATGNTSNVANNANAYDISYLMNTVLWDRYFFSGLHEPFSGGNTAGIPVTANSRLKFAAGYAPTNQAMGINAANTTVSFVDPATGQAMFKAFVPARYMMIDGAFNVNSTSYDAWRAVLSAMRGVTYLGNISATPTTNFPRFLPSSATGASPTFTQSVQAFTDGTAGTDTQSYAGFRQLTDNEIDNLAFKIVQQVRMRGPFLSLAQFVNRRIGTGTGTTDPYSYSGVLQTAIDYQNSGPNIPTHNNLLGIGTTGGGSSTTMALWGPANITAGYKAYPDGIPTIASVAYSAASANLNSKVEGIPAWLTQADILQAIGSIIAVRSDTFVIRSYGDVLSPDIPQNTTGNTNIMANAISADPTLIQSRAWCEMVVQRFPDYVDTSATGNDPSATNGVNIPNPSLSGKALSAVNATFGRRFRIVSMRWLNPTDI